MAIPVGNPMVNLGNLYIDGLGIAPGATTSLITMAPGAARDSTNTNDIVLPTAAIINIAASGVNGLDTGTIAINTAYYVYVIGSSLSHDPVIHIETQVSCMAGGTRIINGTVIEEGIVAQPPSTIQTNYDTAAILSLSPVQPVLPFGYDMFRRIGNVATNGAGTIVPFVQSDISSAGSLITYATPVVELAGGASAVFAAIDITSSVPASAANGTGFVQVYLDVVLTPTAPGDTVAFRPTGSASATGNVILSGPVAAVATEAQMFVTASVIAGVVSIDYKVDGAVDVNVIGYINQA